MQQIGPGPVTGKFAGTLADIMPAAAGQTFNTTKYLMRKYDKTPKLKKLISELKINQVMLAELSGMSASSFKNKLSENHPLYGFTDQEYAEVVRVIGGYITTMEKFLKNHDRKKEFAIYASKK